MTRDQAHFLNFGQSDQEGQSPPIDPYAFGGSERQVRRIQKRFLPYFRGKEPVLDIGCGRGVFLEILERHGIHAVGIDIYAPAVAQCRSRGFNAVEASALHYLAEHENSYGGIFCSHVVEHLAFDAATILLRSCAAALVPGGRAVFVTPNPADIGIIGDTFWLDPTHVRPYPIALLQSMAVDAGMIVEESGAFHGGLPKRDLPRFLRYRLLLGEYYGRPNAFVVARRPKS